MKQEELIPHLFRTEYRKIVSVLARRFGFEQLETAEDITSETSLTATQTWGLQGIPKNPTAWLYYVAKNKAKNFLQRNAVFINKVSPEITDNLRYDELEIDLSPQNINDSQLQMMIACYSVGIVSENSSYLFCIVYYKIKVSVIIKIGIGSTITVGGLINSPSSRHVFKSKIAVVFKNIINYI